MVSPKKIKRRKFDLSLDLENIAFDGTARDFEVARILTAVASRLYSGDGGESSTLMDINGGRVGQYEFKEK